MGRLLGYMANRADRLRDALHQEREAIAPPLDFKADGWGIGFYQSGEVLHKKRPQLGNDPIDWSKLAGDVRSHCIVMHVRHATVGDFRADNTHPFRMRQWLFAHNGTVPRFEALQPRLMESMPDFLRRNIRGDTDSEHIFHVILSFLHDSGQLDRQDADDREVLHAIRSATALIDRYTAEVGAGRSKSTLNMLLTNGRTMYAVCRGSPMTFVEREGLHDPATPSAALVSGPASALRYVLVVSDGAVVPSDYRTVDEGTILVIDRDLHVSKHPL